MNLSTWLLCCLQTGNYLVTSCEATFSSFTPPRSLTVPPFTDNVGFLWKRPQPAQALVSSCETKWATSCPGRLLLSDKSSYWRCCTNRAQIWRRMMKKMDGRREERGEDEKKGIKKEWVERWMEGPLSQTKAVLHNNTLPHLFSLWVTHSSLGSCVMWPSAGADWFRAWAHNWEYWTGYGATCERPLSRGQIWIKKCKK